MDEIDTRLRAAARALTPPEGAQARVAERLAKTFAQPAARFPLRAAVGAVAMALTTFALLTLREPRPRRAPSPFIAAPAITREPVAIIATPEVARPPLEKTAAQNERHATPAVVTRTVQASIPTTPEDTLAAEQSLLQTARAAFERNDLTQTRAQLAAFDARFPHAELGEERDALWIYLLARDGHSDNALTRFEQFTHAYPHSSLRERLRSAIDEGEPR